MLSKIEKLKEKLELKPEHELEIQSYTKQLLSQNKNFYQQIQRWGKRHCSGYLLPGHELLLDGFYEAVIGGEYQENLYTVVYRQTLNWYQLGLCDTDAVLLYNKIRQLVTSYGNSFGYSRLAYLLNQVVDLCISLSVEVRTLLFKMVHIKQAAEYESQRINQVFSILSSNLPSDLVKAYVKHQNWKYQVFALALGQGLDTVVEPLPIESCHLSRWLKQDNYRSVDRKEFDALHKRAHVLSSIIVNQATEHRPEQVSVYLQEFEQTSEELGRLLLECLEKHIAQMATHDQLTRLLNRTTLEAKFSRERALAQRLGQTLGLILIDIDHFKQINDKYGHFVGDMVLVEFARLLEQHARMTDMVFRWGGEEFVIFGMLEPNPAQGMQQFAERIRQAVEQAEFCKQMKALQVTISAGVVEFPASSGLSLQRVFAQADTLLYQAKQQGRNQVQAAFL